MSLILHLWIVRTLSCSLRRWRPAKELIGTLLTWGGEREGGGGGGGGGGGFRRQLYQKKKKQDKYPYNFFMTDLYLICSITHYTHYLTKPLNSPPCPEWHNV